MISILCTILRPACVTATLLMMGVMIAYFWGHELVTGYTVWRLFLSYCVLMVGSYVVFYIDDPANVLGRRNGR